ncbi:arginase [Plasmodium gonderi]|uniref:Arginase n=1 Tax=Plasmodium gonderi TaxID=77519 RepID=A0A1Y1JD15_PLAGO|nr:arginase [Plasmodium gonderi]GAW80130.1 arginase [Plasmodium gonderi]
MNECIENYIKTFKEEENLYVKKNVSIIGSPLSAGQSLGGVHLACDNLRMLGLHKVIKAMGWSYEDVGNVWNKDITGEIVKENLEINGKQNTHKNTNTYIGKENYRTEGMNVNGKLKYVCNGKEGINTGSHNNVTAIVNGDDGDGDDGDDGKVLSKKYSENIYYNNIKNIEIIGKFCEKLFFLMSNELKKKNFVLNIGGDHSVAFPSILSSLQIYKDLRVIWIDAHGDINIPETSPSGYYHGMSLAHTLGLFKKKVPYFEWSEHLTYLKPENVAIIGIRDVDTYEKIILRKCNVNYFTIFDIEKNGIYNIISKALNIIDPNEKYPIHISFDVDSVDSFYAPGTGTIAKGGLSYRETNLLMKVLADTRRVVSMDVVEYNPSLDEDDKRVHGDSLPIAENATKTGKLCLELIARVLGYDIV